MIYRPASPRRGAGIPWTQRLALRWYFRPFVAGRSDWNENWRAFDGFNHKLLSLLKPLDETRLTRRVLVPPLPGLEDSSRYWSAAMTLEHLSIVGRGVVSIIRQIANGSRPAGTIRTADVKPAGTMTGAESVADFQDFIKGARLSVESTVLLPVDRTLTFAHPWMREIDALQWQWLLGAHTAVHYRQMKLIVAGL